MNKKIIAAILAAVMVLGSSLTAMAAKSTGEVTGEGKLEGTVNTDVFHVVLPVIETESTILDFTLDPEGLISQTEAAAYSDKTFEEGGTLFFANAAVEESEGEYSSTSDALTVINKSSVDVDITVTAEITGYTGIALTDDNEFADDTTASMYLAIKDVDGENPFTDDGVSVTAMIDAAPDEAYEYTYKESKYNYELIADTTGITFKKYEFNLTGAANAAGDWSSLAEVAPSVTLVWTVVFEEEVPVVVPTEYVSSTTVSSSSNSVTLTLPESVTVSSIVINKVGGGTINCVEGTHYTMSESTLEFSSITLTNNIGGTATITYNNDHKDTLSIQ